MNNIFNTFFNNIDPIPILNEIYINILTFNDPLSLLIQSIYILGAYTWYFDKDINKFTEIICYILNVLKTNKSASHCCTSSLQQILINSTDIVAKTPYVSIYKIIYRWYNTIIFII